MTRQFVASVVTAFLLIGTANSNAVAQQTATSSQKPQTNPPDEAAPPEEDESLIPEKVPLNPMESERSIRVGNYYMHKGKYRAALQRFELAARYNPNSPEAFFKVGEAEEKLKNSDAAKLAFEKVMRLAPNTKIAQEAQKKIDRKS